MEEAAGFKATTLQGNRYIAVAARCQQAWGFAKAALEWSDDVNYRRELRASLEQPT